MTQYIAFLRGINVGGHNIIKMKEFKLLLLNLGLEKVNTYIQSGNVVFQSDKNAEQLQLIIEREINDVYGYSVTVMIRTASEFAEIINNCPYPVDSLAEGESVHLALWEKEPAEERIKQLLDFKRETEECCLTGKEVYLYLRLGVQDSKLAVYLQKLGGSVTMRNWKTIKKLENMVNAMSK